TDRTDILVAYEVCRALFDLEGARAAHHEAATISEPMHSPIFTQIILPELCADYVLGEEWTAAHAYAQQALATHDDTCQPGALIRLYEIEALVHAGALDVAAGAVARLEAVTRDNSRYRVAYLRAAGALARARRTDAARREAVAYLAEAAQLATEIGLPGELWAIHAELAHRYEALGEAGLAHAADANRAAIVKALAAQLESDDRDRFIQATSHR
ncbi:MAG: hypothetical protein H3C34_24865, partial [Caldilineaceae bacterium]|nr:hypothetical protein [Caldilineaceae bacterium]